MFIGLLDLYQAFSHITYRTCHMVARGLLCAAIFGEALAHVSVEGLKALMHKLQQLRINRWLILSLQLAQDGKNRDGRTNQ